MTREEKIALVRQKMAGENAVPIPAPPVSGMTREQKIEMVKQKMAGESSPVAKSSPETGTVEESFLQNVGQATSMGYLPQLQAAAEPYIQKGLDFLGFGDADANKQLEAQGFKINNLPEKNYVQRRDEATKRIENVSAAHPGAAILGQVAGAIPSAIATGGLLKAGVGAGGKLLQATKAGGIIGLIRNPGDVEGEINPLQLKERAINTAKDAATGAVLQGTIGGVGKISNTLKQAPESLKKWSQLKAVKAGGAMLKDFRKLMGQNKTQEIGQTMIDNNIVSVGDDITSIAAKADTALRSAGSELGSIYQAADDSTKIKINSKDITGLYNDYLEGASKRLSGIDGGEQAAQRAQKTLDVLMENQNPTFKELQKLRASIDENINFSKQNKELPVIEKELKFIRGKIQGLIRSKLNDIDPNLGSKFDQTNRKVSNLMTISQMAKDKAARESSNAAFGLRERISGGAGAAVGGMMGSGMGGPIGAAIGATIGGGLSAVTTKTARQYGTPYVAITANKIAKALEKNPKLLSKYAEPLAKASQKSLKEFVNTVNVFLSEPEFKRKLRRI
jgi:uncharacterized protein YgiM (DUF1202 family)